MCSAARHVKVDDMHSSSPYHLCWTDDGLFGHLSEYISGAEWLRLTSTCKSFRQYSVWNKHFSVKYPCKSVKGKIRDLPLGLTRIEISCSISARDVQLPETLTHLVIDFNNKVNNWKLPDGLKSLTLGDSFAKTVRFWKLPEGLEEIYVGKSFRHDVHEWTLPKGLKKLVFSNESRAHVGGWTLPDGLQHLECYYDFSDNYTDWFLPRFLKIFVLNVWSPRTLVRYYQLKLPETLDTLVVTGCLSLWQNTEILPFPKNLRVLLANTLMLPKDVILPRNLQVFGIGNSEWPNRIIIQENLKVFSVGSPLPTALMNEYRIDPEVFRIWNQIKFDMLSGYLNHSTIPDSVTHMIFGEVFHQNLQAWKFPKSLKYLRVGRGYNQDVTLWDLPGSLLKISLGNDYKGPSHSRIQTVKECIY